MKEKDIDKIREEIIKEKKEIWKKLNFLQLQLD